MKNPLLLGPFVVAALLFPAATVHAQPATTTTTTTPTYEFSGGYQLFRVGQVCNNDPLTQTCTANRTFPLGFAVDVARNFGAFGVVGEGGWSTDSEEDLDFNVWHLAGGARWTSRHLDRLYPYGQFLVGMVQDRVSGSVPGVNVDRSITSFMFQPGVGATFLLGQAWGVVGQIDFRRVLLDEDENLSGGRNDFRFFLGARVLLP
jgi:hypothetical protein